MATAPTYEVKDAVTSGSGKIGDMSLFTAIGW